MRCFAVFGADGVMEQMITMPFGQMPGAAVMGLATNDTFQHGWDLAKATGQSTDLAPALAASLLVQAKATIPPAFRGPERAPSARSNCPRRRTAADRLAAVLGLVSVDR